MTHTMTAGGNITAGRLRQFGAGSEAAGVRKRSKRASRNIFLAVSSMVLAVFILVGLSAYAASIQHANNVLTQENEYLQAEIDSLRIQIVEETKVTRVEEVATTKYGMVYPSSENCVVINEKAENSHSLAASIRSEAYN